MSESTQDSPSSPREEGASVVPADLLKILVCPLGKQPLRLEETSLVCTRCGARFQIHDGIPNMLIEDAELPDGVKSVEELACYAETAK